MTLTRYQKYVENEPVLRLFLGIGISDSKITSNLAGEQVRLSKMLNMEQMYFPPTSSFHITQLFIGNVEKKDVEHIDKMIRYIVLNFPAPKLSIGGCKTFSFYGTNIPRTFYAGVGGDTKSLFDINTEIAKALRPMKFKMSVSPHVTLCKYSKPKVLVSDRSKLLSAKDEFNFGLVGEMKPHHITLFHSVPNIDTSIYVPVRIFPFKKY